MVAQFGPVLSFQRMPTLWEIASERTALRTEESGRLYDGGDSHN